MLLTTCKRENHSREQTSVPQLHEGWISTFLLPESTMAKNIQHLVVLMLENRSFDHALGFLKSNSYPIDGLNGDETNPDSAGVSVTVSADARYAGDLGKDPAHDFIGVNEQIFGNSQGTGSGPFMKGFVKNYQSKT